MPDQLDLKKTINLPKTDFSMRAKLPTLEPRRLAQWEEMGLAKKMRSETFILHDGPAYAKGHCETFNLQLSNLQLAVQNEKQCEPRP